MPVDVHRRRRLLYAASGSSASMRAVAGSAIRDGSACPCARYSQAAIVVDRMAARSLDLIRALIDRGSPVQARGIQQ